MLSAHWELDGDASLKEKSSGSILLLFTSEIQHSYISYRVAIIHSQQSLLLGKYCLTDASQT